MKNKKMLLVLILIFVLVLAGAYGLYSKLSPGAAPDQLTAQGQPTEESKAPEVSETPAPTAEPEPSESPKPAESPEAAIAPDFTVYDREGNPVNLADYFGKPIVLNFWASWCGPCRSEMPEFQQKYLELDGEVTFLMINMTGGRETMDSAVEFIDGQGYTFPVLFDLDGDAAVTYGAYSLPTTYFIDGQGHAIARAVGAIDGDTLQMGIDMIYSKP